jgi:hypothetical protein
VPALALCHAFYTVYPVSPVILGHRIVALVPSLLAPRLMMSCLAPLPVTVKEQRFVWRFGGPGDRSDGGRSRPCHRL